MAARRLSVGVGLILGELEAMSEDLYIFGDADRVRDRIEGLLLGPQPAEVRAFSDRLTTGLAELVRSAQIVLAAEMLMVGGDEVLFRVKQSSYQPEKLADLARDYREATRCSISFGVGPDIASAYLNLRRAKATGGGTTIGGTAAT